MKPLRKSQVARLLRRCVNDALRPYRIKPMDEPAAPDVSCDFEVSGYSHNDATDDIDDGVGEFIDQVLQTFKDRVADTRVEVVVIPDAEWVRRTDYSPGNYFVTLTASLTALG
jgi:hypothetical protein